MEMVKKENRSVVRTKKLIREGFLSLLKEKNIKEISVSELVNYIDINRGTFYFHYKDIYDLLEQIENEIFTQLKDIYKNTDCKSYNIVTQIFQMLKENQETCRILLGPNGDSSFLTKMKEIVSTQIFSLWESTGTFIDLQTEKFTYELFCSYIICGFSGIAETWLFSDMSKSPQEMTEFTTNISHASFEAFKERPKL